jgi:HEAT repeat protein
MRSNIHLSLHSFRTGLISWIVTAAFWPAASGFAQPTSGDRVEALREALRTPVLEPDDVGARRELLAKRIAALRDPGELREALLLDWQDQDDQRPGEPAAQVNRSARGQVIERLSRSIRSAMASTDGTDRAAALTMLGEIGTKVRGTDNQGFARTFTAEAAKLAKDKEVQVQVATARALGKINPEPAVAAQALKNLLESSEVGARRAAASALSEWMEQIGSAYHWQRLRNSQVPPDFSAVVPTCALIVPLAANALGDRDPEVRRLGCEGLRQATIKLTELLPAVHDQPVQRNMEEPVVDVSKLREALAAHEGALIKLLDDANLDVCLAAGKSLEALAGARRMLKDGAKTRLVAARNGGSDTSGAGALDKGLEAAVPVLGKKLAHSDVRIRLAALYVLETLEQAAAPVAEEVVKALRDPNSFVRWGACRTLGKIAPLEPDKAVPGLAPLLEDENWDVRITAAAALERYGPAAKAAAPALAKAVNRGKPEIRLWVIRAVVAVGPEARPAVPALVTALADPDERIRAAAAKALGKFRPHAPAALEALRKGLGDSAADVREAASDALLAGK